MALFLFRLKLRLSDAEAAVLRDDRNELLYCWTFIWIVSGKRIQICKTHKIIYSM